MAGIEERRRAKGIFPRKRLIENGAEGKNVGAFIGRLLLEDFRRHVAEAAGDARGGLILARAGVIGARKATRNSEVEDFYLTVRSEQDIFRLDVAMLDARAMRGCDSRGALRRHG